MNLEITDAVGYECREAVTHIDAIGRGAKPSHRISLRGLQQAFKSL